MAEVGKRLEGRLSATRARFTSPVDTVRFVIAQLVLAIGALMMAEGILRWVSGNWLFYEGVNPAFEFVVGFIAVILAATIIPRQN